MPLSPEEKIRLKNKYGLKTAVKPAHPSTVQPVTDKHGLKGVLSQASDLKHSLMLQHLYSIATMKVLPGEIANPTAAKKCQEWHSTILSVAVQQLFHLGALLNIHSSVGVNPHLRRPNFPTDPSTYPSSLHYELLPFNLHTVKRFLGFQRPVQRVASSVFVEPYSHELKAHGSKPEAPSFNVLETYEVLRNAFNDPISGTPKGLNDIGFGAGVGQELFEVPGSTSKWPAEWGRIHDRASVQSAIDRILAEGEGSQDDHADSHFGKFCVIRNELEAIVGKPERDHDDPCNPVAHRLSVPHKHELAAIPSNTEFSFSALKSPMVKLAPEADPNLVTIIDPTNTWCISLMQLFNSVYDLLIVALAGAWSLSPSNKKVAQLVTNLLHSAVIPISQILCRTRTFGYFGRGRKLVEGMAGPSFYLSINAQAWISHPKSITLGLLRRLLTNVIKKAKDLASRADAYNDLWNTVVNDQHGLPSFLGLLADPTPAPTSSNATTTTKPVEVVTTIPASYPIWSLATTSNPAAPKSREFHVQSVQWNGVIWAHPRVAIVGAKNTGDDHSGTVGRVFITNLDTNETVRVFGINHWLWQDMTNIYVWPVYHSSQLTPEITAAVQRVCAHGAKIRVTAE